MRKCKSNSLVGLRRPARARLARQVDFHHVSRREQRLDEAAGVTSARCGQIRTDEIAVPPRDQSARRQLTAAQRHAPGRRRRAVTARETMPRRGRSMVRTARGRSARDPRTGVLWLFEWNARGIDRPAWRSDRAPRRRRRSRAQRATGEMERHAPVSVLMRAISSGEREDPAAAPAPCTRRANAVSRPTMPNGASSNAASFASYACGAWSGRDAVDHAVLERRAQRRDVGRLAQRRVHLRVACRTLRRRSSVSVKWCGVTSAVTLDAALLGFGGSIATEPARGHVAQVDAPARQLGEQHVARHHDLFRGRRDPLRDPAGWTRALRASRRRLASVGSSQWSATGMPKVRAYSSAVRIRWPDTTGWPSSGDGDRARAHQLAELGQPLALLTRPRSPRWDARASSPARCDCRTMNPTAA